jgi:hypothetical protein
VQFHADSALTYRCEPYSIYWGIQGWSAYRMDRQNAVLAKNETLSRCLAACEQDARNEIQTEA